MHELDSLILREIGAISRCIQAQNDTLFRADGLQKGQFVFITRICENEGISLTDLTRLLKVDKATTTKAVQKLIAAGFIEKIRDTADLRIWRLHPLSRAKNLYPALIAEENKNVRLCFGALSDEERTTADRLTERMRVNLEAGITFSVEAEIDD